MKLKLVSIFVLVIVFTACENQSTVFDDFGSTSVFFPYQTPARTLVLGDYDLGFNDNDNNGRFEIGVVMSGVYENTKDRTIHFELAPELINATTLGVDTVNVKMLPASYYTIEKQSPVVIPAGSVNGRIPVQLSDAFFDDPLSFANFGDVHYVIPLKITNYEEIDSLLVGVPLVDDPIKIKDEDWQNLPKDYTLFGIKFMNKYSGKHLRRGENVITGTKDSVNVKSGNSVITAVNEKAVYRAEYIVKDEVTSLTTSGKNQVTNTYRINRGTIPSDDDLSINLQFADNGDITVSPVEGSNQTVVGTGKWVAEGDEWGGKKHSTIYLDYQFNESTVVEIKKRGRVTDRITVDLLHNVKDTLVMRDRDVKFEEFVINLEKQ